MGYFLIIKIIILYGIILESFIQEIGFKKMKLQKDIKQETEYNFHPRVTFINYIEYIY